MRISPLTIPPPDRHRLALEKSPYLARRAGDPVDWYPWGPEAFEAARKENKPILLSIGSSACHWCRIMAHESFGDEEIAALMNRRFINILVDKEERPDLEEIYQEAVRLMGVEGGWPLTVFLTPDAAPFFGGTYFPAHEGHGHPSFSTVLRTVHDIWSKRPQVVENNSGYVSAELARTPDTTASHFKVGPVALRDAADGLISRFDPVHGGFGHCPKFPQPMALSYLLRHHRATGEAWYKNAVVLALQSMARGGIYDHLGGGFHRYASDERWCVPRFEKMLPDNALLVSLYLDAYAATGMELFRTTAQDTLDFMRRELLHEAGGFSASLSADSEEGEGEFYLWTFDEIVGALGPERGGIFCAAYGITRKGALGGGRNVLHISDAQAHEEVSEVLEDCRRKLFELREKRPRPVRDDMVVTAWNGLAISACARASEVLDSIGYRHLAEETVECILSRCFRNGRLLRYRMDGEGHQCGCVQDYAFFARGLLDLYQAGGEERYLDLAIILTERMNDLFRDPAGGYFLTAHDHAPLIHRPLSVRDRDVPSGTGVAAQNLLILSSLTKNTAYTDMARAVFTRFLGSAVESPLAFAGLLSAVDYDVRGPIGVVILGKDSDLVTRKMVRSVHQAYLPNRMVVLRNENGRNHHDVPPGVQDLLTGKKRIRGRPTAYVCSGPVCSRPVTDTAALLHLLENK